MELPLLLIKDLSVCTCFFVGLCSVPLTNLSFFPNTVLCGLRYESDSDQVISFLTNFKIKWVMVTKSHAMVLIETFFKFIDQLER